MNCWQKQMHIRKYDILIGETTDFGLTRNKLYVVLDNNMGYELISVKNDNGIIETYTTEYFRFYNGEKVA